MADTKISALPAATALTGTEVLPAVQGTGNVKVTVNQVRDFIGPGGLNPNYISGRWYVASGASAQSVISVQGRIHLSLLPIFSPATINALGIRVTVAANPGLFDLAIYANNPATMRPTGIPLIRTLGVDTVNAMPVAKPLTVSQTLVPGYYWAALIADANADGVAGFQAVGQTNASIPALAGMVDQTKLNSGNANSSIYATGAYGATNDLTSQTCIESAAVNAYGPLLNFRIA